MATAYPEDRRYTPEHEWVADSGEGAGVRVGITDYAQESLGDIVYVTLPEPGTQVSAGQPLGEVESTKSVNEVYAPVTGTVVARNEELDATPDLINSDPYGAGWMVEIRPAEPAQLDALLDASAYSGIVGSEDKP